MNKLIEGLKGDPKLLEEITNKIKIAWQEKTKKSEPLT